MLAGLRCSRERRVLSAPPRDPPSHRGAPASPRGALLVGPPSRRYAAPRAPGPDADALTRESTEAQGPIAATDARDMELGDRYQLLCVACRRRVALQPEMTLEQLCDRCWRLLAPELVEESETLL